MPNRIIRESCRTSKTLDRLSAEAERLCWRLTTVADDYGRFEAEPVIVRAQCFPLKESLTSLEVEKWLLELAGISDPMIVLYEAEGKRYGAFLKWEKHQTVRAKRSKYPEPTDANICKQVLADASKCARIRIRDRERNRDTRTAAKNGPLDLAFDQFWTTYPRKEAKKRAQDAWSKLKPDAGLAKIMLDALELHKRSRKWQSESEFIPYPATWINERRWEDEIEPATHQGAQPNGRPTENRAITRRRELTPENRIQLEREQAQRNVQTKQPVRQGVSGVVPPTGSGIGEILPRDGAVSQESGQQVRPQEPKVVEASQ